MKSKRILSTRRSLLRRSGTLVAASLAAPLLSVAGEGKENDAESMAKFALEGSTVQMDERQLQSLKREMASVGKTLARLRKIKLRNGEEPVSTFRP